MNPLPSMIVLDFCEWLKGHSVQQTGDNNTDMYDWIFDDKYRDELERLAEEYLNDECLVRRLFYSFIDSKEFGRLFKKACYQFCREELDYKYINHQDVLYCLHHALDKVFNSFLHRYCSENSNDMLYGVRITSELLADSVRRYFNNKRQEDSVMELMMPLATNLSLEIDFLEWLMLNYGKYSNLKIMPLPVFEKLADDYCKYANRQSNDKKKLVKSFKRGDTESLMKKLLAVLTPTQADRMKSLGYIYSRYSSEKVSFRCFFLPLASKRDAFERFINDNWLDLNAMSSDYLDIFYSKEDFAISGYEIKNNMCTLSKELQEKLPCLVIWKDSLRDAQTIDIEGLSDGEIVRLIAKIVELIKEDSSLDKIVAEGINMANEFNKKHVDDNRPVTKNVFNIEKNTGVVAGHIANSEVTVYSGTISDIEFENETKKAIEMIQSFSEVEKKYRDDLINLVKEANAAIKNKDEVAKTKCKSKFAGFMMGAGKSVGEIVTKLSELATIASFFGLTGTILLP